MPMAGPGCRSSHRHGTLPPEFSAWRSRRALVTPEFRLLDGYGLYGGDNSTAAATRATGIVPNTTTRNSVSLPIG